MYRSAILDRALGLTVKFDVAGRAGFADTTYATGLRLAQP